MKTLTLTLAALFVFAASPAMADEHGDMNHETHMEATQYIAEGEPHPDATYEAEHAAHSHHCPMHPEVTGKEGDRCPKCGMFLTPVDGEEKADEAHDHMMDHEDHEMDEMHHESE